MISKSHGWIFLPTTTTTTTTSSSSFSQNYSYDNDKKKKFSSSSLFASYSSNTGSNDDDDEEPDLFDYFDPLKSPHEYPNGIDDSAKSDNKKETSNNDNDNDNNNNNDEKMYSINVFGMDKLQKQQQQQQQQGEDAASTAASSSSTQTSAAEVSSSTEQDLFDYFDPLKSPHEYPNGIDNSNTAMKKDGEEEEDSSDDNNNYTNVSTSSDNNNKPYSMNVFGMDYGLPVKPLEVVSDDESTTSTSTPASASASPKSAVEDKKENQDLFDYFDPLKSPHEYPNGIGKNTANNTNDNDDDEEDRYDPLDLRKKRNAIMEMEDGNNSNTSSSRGTSNDNTQTTKVGILLMDHGSRNQDSNKRLQYIAELYQQMTIMESEQEGNNNSAGTSTSISATTVVVRAAHMEIATPSIPDGLQSLLDENVDEIICHPFFLSPAGRHVREDIPAIIDQAIETLDIDIPIITTEPIGSNIQLMIGAIHASVRENSNLLIKQQKSTKS